MSVSAPVELLFPPGLGRPGRWRPHLGMAYLQAALADRGVQAVQCLPPTGTSARDIGAEILSRQPRVVGFSVYDSNLRVCLNLAHRIKRASPDTWVVFGGPTPTFAWEWILRAHDCVDLCVLGESEETGPTLFEVLGEGQGARRDQLFRLPGLAFRADERVVSTGLPPLAGTTAPGAVTLDRLRSPYLSGVLTDGRAGVLSARGCTFGCVYCSFAALGRRTHRVHSPARIIEELAVLADRMRLGGDRYDIPVYDDTFGLKLSCLTRGDILDRETLRIMRQAGFASLGLGLESAVPSVLRAIGKVRPPDTTGGLDPEIEYLERFRETVRSAKDLGFIVGVSIMTGLPTETEAEAARTIQFVESLPVDHYLHNILRVVPGTPLWHSQERYGLASPVGTLGLPVTMRWPYDWSRVKPGLRSDVRARAANLRWRAITAFSGCGSLLPGLRGLSTAVVRADRLSAESARWLADVLGVGGWLVQVYSHPGLIHRREAMVADRQAAIRAHVPYRHYLQLVPEARDGATERWHVVSESSDGLEEHYQELLSFSAHAGSEPLANWVDTRFRTADICDVLRPRLSGGCLSRLEDRVRSSPLARLMLAEAPPPVMAYSARWTDAEPPCLRLSRIEIDDRGMLRVCRHGEPLGTVGDTLAVIAERLENLRRAAIDRRARWCRTPGSAPGCPFPDLDDRSYCATLDESERRLWRVLDLLARAPGAFVEIDGE